MPHLKHATYILNPSLNSYPLSCQTSESSSSQWPKQSRLVNQSWKVKENPRESYHWNQHRIWLLPVVCKATQERQLSFLYSLLSDPLTGWLALSLQPHWSSLFFKHTKSILISNLYICCAFFFESISLIFLCDSNVPPSDRLSCQPY